MTTTTERISQLRCRLPNRSRHSIEPPPTAHTTPVTPQPKPLVVGRVNEHLRLFKRTSNGSRWTIPQRHPIGYLSVLVPVSPFQSFTRFCWFRDERLGSSLGLANHRAGASERACRAAWRCRSGSDQDERELRPFWRQSTQHLPPRRRYPIQRSSTLSIARIRCTQSLPDRPSHEGNLKVADEGSGVVLGVIIVEVASPTPTPCSGVTTTCVVDGTGSRRSCSGMTLTDLVLHAVMWSSHDMDRAYLTLRIRDCGSPLSRAASLQRMPRPSNGVNLANRQLVRSRLPTTIRSAVCREASGDAMRTRGVVSFGARRGCW